MALIIDQSQREAKPLIHLAPKNICESCPHKNECNEEFRDEHLNVEILQSLEDTNVFYGGYICIGNRRNNVPYDKGSSERLFLSHLDDLSEMYKICPL